MQTKLLNGGGRVNIFRRILTVRKSTSAHGKSHRDRAYADFEPGVSDVSFSPFGELNRRDKDAVSIGFFISDVNFVAFRPMESTHLSGILTRTTS